MKGDFIIRRKYVEIIDNFFFGETVPWIYFQLFLVFWVSFGIVSIAMPELIYSTAEHTVGNPELIFQSDFGKVMKLGWWAMIELYNTFLIYLVLVVFTNMYSYYRRENEGWL